MKNEFFKITGNDFPNSVYCAVGKITMHAQHWEEDFKKLALMLNLKVKNVEKLSLNKLNDALKKNGIINENYSKKLKDVINIRNYINHKFFLIDFEETFTNYDNKIKEINKKLNTALFLIFEANDVISNLLDELNGINCKRPTVFD